MDKEPLRCTYKR